MTASKRTSLIFDTWQALYEVLVAAAWPVHPDSGAEVEVFFGDVDGQKAEAVVVTGVPQIQPTQDWATMGAPSKNEVFVLQIVVGTKAPGMTRWEALDRIKDLCAVIEVELRSPTSGRPAGAFSTTVPGVLWWAVAGYSNLEVYALPSEGFGAFAEVNVVFNTRL